MKFEARTKGRHSVLLVLIILSIGHTVHSQSDSCTSITSLPDDNPSNDDLQYLVPSSNSSDGYQVVVPQMSFNCHGRITAWSGLTVVQPNFIVLTHDITFQVWRPTSSQLYTLVGANTLDFSGMPLQNRVINIDNRTDIAYFKFYNESVEEADQIPFQPGDVIGWYIHAKFQTINPPLSVVFRDGVSSDEESSQLQVVDMLSLTAEGQPCEFCARNGNVERINSVVPYVSAIYALSSMVNVSCLASEYSTGTCDAPSTSDTTTPSSTSSTTPPTEGIGDTLSDEFTIPAIVSVVVSIAVLVLLLTIMLPLCICNVLLLHKVNRKLNAVSPAPPLRGGSTEVEGQLHEAVFIENKAADGSIKKDLSKCKLRVDELDHDSYTSSTEDLRLSRID